MNGPERRSDDNTLYHGDSVVVPNNEKPTDRRERFAATSTKLGKSPVLLDPRSTDPTAYLFGEDRRLLQGKALVTRIVEHRRKGGEGELYKRQLEVGITMLNAIIEVFVVDLK